LASLGDEATSVYHSQFKLSAISNQQSADRSARRIAIDALQRTIEMAG
jgi:hypothetical protein